MRLQEVLFVKFCGKVYKNGESGENWPWVGRIIKLDDKWDSWESAGDFHANGETCE